MRDFPRPAVWACALTLCVLLGACTGRTELYSNLREEEANEMLAVLLHAGIGADKQALKGGVTLRVDGNRLADAVTLLKSEGLPHDPHIGFGEVFRKDGLISSPVEERARYIYAMSQELSYTLSQIDGVLSARVHIVLPQPGSVNDTPQTASAAVFIKYRPDSPLDSLQPQIRRLIANSIPDLSPDKISFVFVPGAVAPAAGHAPGKVQTSPRWRDFLGLRVAPESFMPLVGALTAAALIAVGSLAVCGMLALRGRSGTRKIGQRVEAEIETMS